MTSWFSFLIEFLIDKRLVSSAKWWTLQNFIAWFRSFIHNKNSRGPRTYPWGTAQFIAARPEPCTFLDTYWQRLDRYDLDQSIETPRIPQWINFANSIWRYTVPKAFYKSKNPQKSIFSSSRAFLIFSVTLIKAWYVEYLWLNPNCKLQIMLLFLKKAYNLLYISFFKYFFNIW